ncbi:MAG: TetR family transcriptional regulator [Candidatus Binataceae bacterium]|nr:TetR family transcriptional regulator [Candidatus Binataceae bacterium]
MRKPGSNGAQTLRNLRIAAIQLLSEHGYQAMNLRMLAGKVGVQAGSLYNYIESKQQLLFWLLQETTQKLLVEFDLTLNAIDDPEERLRQFVAFHLRYHIANRKQSSVLQTEMRSLTAKNYHAIAKLQRLYTDKVRGIIEHGARVGRFHVEDAEIATFAFLQMLTAIIRWYRPQGRLSLNQLVEIYTDLTFGMLRADDGAGTRRVALSEAPPRRRLRAITPAARRLPPADSDNDADLIAES